MDDFKALIPEQYQEMGLVKESENIDTFFQRVSDLNDHRGNSIRIPSEEAGKDQWTEFSDKLAAKVPGLTRLPQKEDEGYAEMMNNVFNQLGRPAEAAGYAIPEVPEGIDMKAEGFQEFGELAHTLGLSQAQFDALAKRELDGVVNQGIAGQAAKKEVTDALKAEWGQAYETKTGVIKNLLERILPSVKDTALEDFGVDTCKDFLALAEVLNTEGGDAIDLGMQGQEPGVMTPAEANERIMEIRNNREHPYHDRMKPGHEDAQKTMRELYKLVHGTKPAGEGISVSLTV